MLFDHFKSETSFAFLLFLSILFNIIDSSSLDPFNDVTEDVFLNLNPTESKLNEPNWPRPPTFEKKAQMARYLIHSADWGVFATASAKFNGTPFGTVESFADGPVNESTGVPYLYLADVSTIIEDTTANPAVTLTASLAQSQWCARMKLDPQSPLCARVALVGKMSPVNDSSERTFAQKALFSRHPVMASWPASHGWRFYRLNIATVWLIDFFGGAAIVPLSDYYKARHTDYSPLQPPTAPP